LDNVLISFVSTFQPKPPFFHFNWPDDTEVMKNLSDVKKVPTTNQKLCAFKSMDHITVSPAKSTRRFLWNNHLSQDSTFNLIFFPNISASKLRVQLALQVSANATHLPVL